MKEERKEPFGWDELVLLFLARANRVELLFRTYFVVLSEDLFKRATACSCLTQEIQILLESVLSLSCNCNDNKKLIFPSLG